MALTTTSINGHYAWKLSLCKQLSCRGHNLSCLFVRFNSLLFVTPPFFLGSMLESNRNGEKEYFLILQISFFKGLKVWEQLNEGSKQLHEKLVIRNFLMAFLEHSMLFLTHFHLCV